MANEFKHGTVGTTLTQAEWESTTGHVLNSQATGDIIYASSATQLSRLGIGSTDQVLKVAGGVPAWGTDTTNVAASALTGTTMAANVVASSLTSVGTLTDLTVSGTSTTIGTVTSGIWQGTAVASAYLDADTAHLSGTQTFSGAKTFSSTVGITGNVTFGVDDTGVDVTFFGATASKYMMWDESSNTAILADSTYFHFGTDSDAYIYHSGSNMALRNSTGVMYFQYLDSTSKKAISYDQSGNVWIYHADTAVLKTISGGIHIDGKLGVGTTTPDYDFEVETAGAEIFAHYTSNSRGGIKALSSSRLSIMTTAVADDIVFGYSDTGPADDGSDFTERMRIDNGTGAVGIGTSSPVAQNLHLYTAATTGTVPLPMLSLEVSDDGADTAAGEGPAINFYIADSTTDSTGTGTIYARKGAGNSHLAGQIATVRHASATDAVGDGSLTFSTGLNAGALSEKMRITGAGYVGIGNVLPDYPLHINVANEDLPMLKLEADMGTNNNRELTIKSPSTDSSTEPFRINSSNALAFETDGTQRMLIDASGNLSVQLAATFASTVSATGHAYIYRNDTGYEGGQLNFGRAVDNAVGWAIDSYGNDANDTLRFLHGSWSGSVAAQFVSSVDTFYVYHNFQVAGTNPRMLIGDGGAEDTMLIFDGNAADYYMGIADTNDDFYIGTGYGMGSNPVITISSTPTVGLFRDAGANNLISIRPGGATLTGANAEGSAIYVEVATQNFDNASSTLAIQSALSVRAQTYTGDNATLTLTEAASIYAEVPVAGTNVSIGTAYSILATGVIKCTSVTETSDIAFKENIQTIDSATDVVKKLRPVTFDWKEDKKSAAGFIAQDVEELFPYIVDGESGNKSVRYTAILAQVTKALQESIEKIETLEKQVTALGG